MLLKTETNDFDSLDISDLDFLDCENDIKLSEMELEKFINEDHDDINFEDKEFFN